MSMRGKKWSAAHRATVQENRAEAAVDRFHRSYMPEPNSGCWLWDGNNTVRDYGRFQYCGRAIMATHMSLMLAGRPVPKGMLACHHCDNPACVNPEHLFVGTYRDNMRDAAHQGRLKPPPLPEPHQRARGARHGSRTKPEGIPKGARNGNAKLNDEIVRAIRVDNRANGVIATQYGVTPQLISQIRTRRSWRHVA